MIYEFFENIDTKYFRKNTLQKKVDKRQNHDRTQSESHRGE